MLKEAVRQALTVLKASFRQPQALVVGTLAVLAACALLIAAAPAVAQSWWPFGGGGEEERPVPREPIYRDPPPRDIPPQRQQGWDGGQAASRNICYQLEQRLVQESNRGNESRAMLPMLESEIRRVEREYHSAREQLDRDCYEYFLFSKTLRKTRKCQDLANRADQGRRRIADLETQMRQLSSGRSYRDEIIRELARNRCGPSYEQQARRLDRGNNFFSMWDDEESSGGGGMGSFGALPYATYRTVCVRLCDGYYFPISFSTLPNHFERDAEVCASKCAAPAELYYYQNPGGSVEQMVAARTNEQYTSLKSAFRYRKEYVQGCSCKISEYVPEPGTPQPQQQGAVAPPNTGEQDRFGAAEPRTPPPATAQRAPQPLPWER